MAPPFAKRPDADAAAVLSYVRQTYGKDAGAITPAEVKAERSKL